MAAIYKRGRTWWVKFHHRGQVIRRTLRTTNRQLARERARATESQVKDDAPVSASACTRTPLASALEEYCIHLRTTKTLKSAQTDIYFLRQIFGPACPAMQVNSRKPISDRQRKQRLAKLRGGELRPGREHLRPTFVEDLTTADVSRMLTQRVRKRKLSPKTGNRLREVVHRVCQWCISQRGVRFTGEKNPVATVERFRERTGTIRFLSLDDIGVQLENLQPRPVLRTMVAVLIYAGLRREELLWLTHDDVDLAARMIRVRAKTINGIFWEPKTKRNRAVPISNALQRIIVATAPCTESPWRFPSPMNCLWDLDNFSATLRKMNRAGGCPWSCLDFRHTFGSQLAQRGVSLYKISELMGNSPDICRRHYAALIPEKLADVVEFDDVRPDTVKLVS